MADLYISTADKMIPFFINNKKKLMKKDHLMYTRCIHKIA